MKTFLAMALLTASGASQAVEYVQLQDMQRSGTTATGKCGAASVKVHGMEADYIAPSGGKIEVASGSAKFTADGSAGPFYFQDRNQVSCVESPTGAKLVIVAHCYARHCLPQDYLVIEPATATQLSKPTDGECTVECAEKALGGPLPPGLRGET